MPSVHNHIGAAVDVGGGWMEGGRGEGRGGGGGGGGEGQRKNIRLKGRDGEGRQKSVDLMGDA